MSYWKTGYRTLNGRRRKVRKLVIDGKIRTVRVANRPHFTDRTAMKRGIMHIRRHVNYPNSAKRVNHYR